MVKFFVFTLDKMTDKVSALLHWKLTAVMAKYDSPVLTASFNDCN